MDKSGRDLPGGSDEPMSFDRRNLQQLGQVGDSFPDSTFVSKYRPPGTPEFANREILSIALDPTKTRLKIYGFASSNAAGYRFEIQFKRGGKVVATRPFDILVAVTGSDYRESWLTRGDVGTEDGLVILLDTGSQMLVPRNLVGVYQELSVVTKSPIGVDAAVYIAVEQFSA